MYITEIETVKRFFNSNYMNANPVWLEDCVKYIIHEMSKNMQKIIEITMQQWFLSDLKNVSSGCLPPNLRRQSKVILNDKYMLQVNSEIDIGSSAYQQYCKLKNVNNDDVEVTLSAEEKIPSNRMLKLSLTDGVEDIWAIEYKTISKIKTSLNPGCKVLIKGPVVCQNGILFLENCSIEVMGGEVAELSNVNVKSDILTSKLGLPKVHPTSNNERIECSEKTKPLIDCNERLCSNEPPGKRQRFSNDQSSELDLDICIDHEKIVSSSPFIYIKQINDMNESIKIGKTCRVKAQILHLLKKPSYSKESWMVECKITDGTGCLNVQIDSNWFSKLVQCTPKKMAELNKIRLSNPDEIPIINRDIIKKLGKAMETLKSLYCIMELTILPMPIIKDFIQFEKEHVILLNRRLQGL